MQRSTTPSTAAAPPSFIARLHPRFVARWLQALLVGLVALFPALASLTNNYTLLRCEREAGHPAGGSCTMTRGSLAFAYDETFFVNDIVAAKVKNSDEPDPNRALDLGGERVYVILKGGDTFRIIDNDVWSRAEREAAADQINTFLATTDTPTLEVVFDRRVVDLIRFFFVGLLSAGLLLGMYAAIGGGTRDVVSSGRTSP